MLEMIEAVIERGHHHSALQPKANQQHAAEVAEKVLNGQARVVNWLKLKHEGVKQQLKLSPIVMIPHKL